MVSSGILNQLNFSLLATRVNDVKQVYELSSEASAFVYMMIEKIYPEKTQATHELVTDGTGDRGVDAIYLRDKGDQASVDIFSFKYRSNLRTAAHNFEETEVVKIFSFINDLFDKKEELRRNCNERLRSKVEDIWSIFESGRICSFKIVLCSNGQPLADDAVDRLQSFCVDKMRVSYEQIDFAGVINLLLQNERPEEVIALKGIDYQIFDRSDGNIRGIVASVEVNSFLDSIVDPHTRSVKRYLFDDNIRTHLGDDGGYNREIIASALDEENSLFWYCNNGITVVCNQYEYQKNIRNPTISITNMQIVNGAQTCYSLLKARELDPLRLSRILLLLKIFETRRRDFSHKVAIATNSQARITLRDLRSNDDIQKKIELLFMDSGYFYERKKNQHADKTARSRIDALTFGQVVLSYRLQQPDRARRESDEIFGSMYSKIFTVDLDRSYVVGLIEIYKIIESRWTLTLQDDTIQTLGRYKDIINYGLFYVVFMVGLIAQRNGKELPDKNEIEAYVKEALLIIDKEISRYKTVSNYDMFRSPKLRERLLEEFGGQGQMEFYF